MDIGHAFILASADLEREKVPYFKCYKWSGIHTNEFLFVCFSFYIALEYFSILWEDSINIISDDCVMMHYKKITHFKTVSILIFSFIKVKCL